MTKTWYSSLWYWRLAIFECLTDAFIAGAMCWVSSVANADWSQLGKTARETIIICTIVTMLKVVKSFLSTTMKVLQDAMPAPNAVVHTETQTTQKTVVDVPPVNGVKES